MPIKVFPSKLDGAPLEVHEVRRVTTVGQWLRDNVPNYRPSDTPPISVQIDGRLIAPELWDRAEFGPSAEVRIYVEPKGAELIIAAVTLGAAFQFVTGLFMPKLPTQSNNGQARGERLSEASVKGNSAKLNSPIREVSGRRKVYPDYLTPPHRIFIDPRIQIAQLLLCVGKGEFDIPASQVLIGDTPAISLGPDAIVNIYPPGADLSADPAAENWHNASEVGSTSTGTAGITLTTTSAVETVAVAYSFVFSGFTVTIPAGQGSFPSGWAAGMIVRLDVKYPYTVTDGAGAGGRDRITGNTVQLNFGVAASIEISGDNAGNYVVSAQTVANPGGTMDLNYADGTPATGLQTGSRRMCIGFRGLRYRITAASSSSITVERLRSSGATDTTWAGFETLTSFDASVILDSSTTEGDWSGPFVACPEGEVTGAIECDIMFPGGLIRVGSKGQKITKIVDVEIQYRDYETAGAWTSVYKQYAGATMDQIGHTERIIIPTMRPEVRVRRIGAQSTDPNTQDRVQWYGLRAKLPAPSSYPGVTVMTLQVKGGDRIASQSESLVSLEATRKLPPVGGGAAIATRDIAPWVQHVILSAGYSLSDIDLTELDRLGDIWAARGDYYDDAIDDRSTVKQVLQDALAAGFAELTIDRGLIRPVRDEPRSTFEQMYTPQNMTEPLTRQFQARTPDDFDGVDVEYTSATTWQIETVQCRLPGDAGTRVEKMRVQGVTSKTQAWRMGMRQRRAQKYRRNTFSFGTEMDAFNSRYLSYCALADDVPGYGQSAILEAVSGSGPYTLVSSEPLEWTPAAPHVVAIRRKDGTLSGPYPATRVDGYRLTVAALDFVPDTSWTVEPPHLLFGTTTRWSYPVLITEVAPSGDTKASVTATNYDVRVYADDDNSPP